MRNVSLKCENCGLKMSLSYEDNFRAGYEAEKYIKSAMKHHKEQELLKTKKK